MVLTSVTSRPAAWLSVQFIVAFLVVMALCVVAISKIADGEQVGMWVTILIVGPVVMAAGGWYVRREILKARHSPPE